MKKILALLLLLSLPAHATALKAVTISGGGSGSGTVNSGTQYQLGYYAATGTAISGVAAITTDANNVLNVAASTVTTTDPALNVTQTWNGASVVFTGLKENITNTASSTSSLLMDLQVGGSSKFSVNESGFISIAGISGYAISNYGGTLAFPSTVFLGGTLIGADNPSGSSMLKLVGTSQTIYFGALNLTGYNNILVLGDGMSSTPATQGVSGQSTSPGTSNTAGGNLQLMGGLGTGTGVGGNIVMQVAPAGTTGTTQNTLSTIATVTPTGITLNGHLGFNNTAPTVSSCGGGTLATGSADNKGQITGITAATACTITFGSALPTAPACTFSTSAGTAVGISAISTSAVTTSMTALTGTLYYICF